MIHSPESLPTASQEEKNAYYRLALTSYIEAVNRGDEDAVCALYSEDAELADPVGDDEKCISGIEKIRAFYKGLVERGVRLELAGPISGSSSHFAAMPLRAITGNAEFSIVSIARFNSGGLIENYSAYWGPGDMRVV